MQDSLNQNFGLELFKLVYQTDRHGVPVETICASLDKYNETEVGALHRMEAIPVDHAVRDRRHAVARAAPPIVRQRRCRRHRQVGPFRCLAVW